MCRSSAGSPAKRALLADEMVEDVYTLPRQVVGDGEVFALTVSGDSMVDAAICDGDIVAVKRQDSADHGDIVAALLEDEATVKVLRRRGRAGVAHAPQSGLRADPRRRGADPRQGRRRSPRSLNRRKSTGVGPAAHAMVSLAKGCSSEARAPVSKPNAAGSTPVTPATAAVITPSAVPVADLHRSATDVVRVVEQRRAFEVERCAGAERLTGCHVG